MAHSLPKLLALAYVAGFLAVLVFHQGAFSLLHASGVVEPPAWQMDPIPPLGVPALISKCFWGGLWAAALAPLLVRITGPAYWMSWTVVGAVALSLVAMYVVPPIKGQPFPDFWPRFGVAATVNGAWGLGTALFLFLFGVARP